MLQFRYTGWIVLACAGCQPLPPSVPLSPTGSWQPAVPMSSGPANAPVQIPMMLVPQQLEPSCAPAAAPTTPQIYFPHQAPVPVAPPQEMAIAEPPLVGGPLSTEFGLPGQRALVSTIPNPLPVRVTNHDFAWDQIVDVVSDYFPIQSEQRVQLVGNVLTEGRIETPFQVGASIFEPQHRDSVGSFNRWESTFQTIRRRASVRVLPDQQGYLVEVQVEKQIEDLPRPETSSAGAATFRGDTSPGNDRVRKVSRSRPSPLWLSLGRDQALEQQILADIRQRLATTP